MSSIAVAFALPSETADASLQKRVVAYLATRNFHSFRRLAVRADRGVVCLSGRLDSYYQRQVAVESARRVAGVTTIVDRIVVAGVSSAAAPLRKFARQSPNPEELVGLIDVGFERLPVALCER
jgi:hypothetical protein